MSENITRISDLPENITIQSTNIQSGNMNDLGLPNSYMPMNVHPNPYGNNNPTQSGSHENVPLYMSPEMTTQRLPSRDIKIDESQYLHDEQIQSNYIPKPKQMVDDYISEYEKMDKKLEKYKEEKHRERLIDVVFTEIQTPIFIAIIYFFFQMPIVNTIFTKYLSALQLYNNDGNINMNGMLIKSVFFGFAFYSFQKLSVWISEL